MRRGPLASVVLLLRIGACAPAFPGPAATDQGRGRKRKMEKRRHRGEENRCAAVSHASQQPKNPCGQVLVLWPLSPSLTLPAVGASYSVTF